MRQPAEVHASCCASVEERGGGGRKENYARATSVFSDTYTYSPTVSLQVFISSRRAAWYRKHRVPPATEANPLGGTHTTFGNAFLWLGKNDTPLWWGLVRFAGCVAWELIKEGGRALKLQAEAAAETARHLVLLPLVMVVVYVSGWQCFLGWCA